MAINVSTLPDYIQENRDELFVKAIASTKTLDYIESMLGVKGKAALNYLNSTVVLADGESCGWNPQGDDTFTQKTVTTKLVAVNKEFCAKQMRSKWMSYDLSLAAGRENLPFEQKIADSNVAAIKKAVEKLIWQGDTGLGIDGLLKQIKAEESAIKVNGGTTILDKIGKVIAAIPAGALEKGVNVFMSYTDFRSYVEAKNAECCGNMPVIDANVDYLVYAGDSRIKLVPVAGLEGTDKIVAAPYDALVYATDVEDSEGIFKMWFDEKEDKFLFKVLFTAGTAVKYNDEVTIWSAE